MSDAPLFGKIKNRNVIDDKGSTMTQAINYMEGNVMYPIRRDYEFRHRLEKTDIARIAEIAEDLINDSTKLDVSLRIEKKPKDDKYYLVECYTKLVY
jgi:hypothetical protein